MVDQNDDNIYSICVPCKEKKGFYRIQTIWNENQLTLTLLDESSAFNSNVSKSNLTKQAAALNMNYEDYIEKIRLGLHSDDARSYLYERKDDMFYIYRQPKTIKIILVVFNLERVNFSQAVESFIDEINKIANVYKAKLETSKKEYNAATEEKNLALQKLEKYITLKEESENKLYSKFILILNEKKERLSHMERLLKKNNITIVEDAESDADESKTKNKKNNKKTIKKNNTKVTKKIEVISESDSDTETEKYSQKIIHKVQIEAEPTKRTFDLLDDESPTEICFPKRLSGRFSDVRSKIDDISTVENTETMTDLKKSDDETQDLLDEMFTSNEMILSMQNSKFLDKEKELSQKSSESLDFCTQDLLDRM